MGWDFETEPAFQAKLDWITTFVREDRKSWRPGDVAALHGGLKAAFDQLAGQGRA